MKNVIIASVFMFFGLFVDIGILLFGFIVGSSLTEWQTSLGPVWTAIFENNLILPFIIATIFMLFGIVILIKEYFTKQ